MFQSSKRFLYSHYNNIIDSSMDDTMDEPLLTPSSPRGTFINTRPRPSKYGATSSSTSTATAFDKCIRAKATQFITHRVAPTDTLYSIAVQYGVPPNQILRVNRLSNAAGLVFRSEIRIPVSGRSDTASTSTSALLPHSVSVPAGLQPISLGSSSEARSDPLSNGAHPASTTGRSDGAHSPPPLASAARGPSVAGPTPASSAGGHSLAPSDIFTRVDTTLARTRARLDQPAASASSGAPARRAEAATRGASDMVAFSSRSPVAQQDNEQLVSL